MEKNRLGCARSRTLVDLLVVSHWIMKAWKKDRKLIETTFLVLVPSSPFPPRNSTGYGILHYFPTTIGTTNPRDVKTIVILASADALHKELDKTKDFLSLPERTPKPKRP